MTQPKKTYHLFDVVTVATLVTIFALLFGMLGYAIGNDIGRYQGWREKTEQVEASFLPTGSQIEQMAQACIDNH